MEKQEEKTLVDVLKSYLEDNSTGNVVVRYRGRNCMERVVVEDFDDYKIWFKFASLNFVAEHPNDLLHVTELWEDDTLTGMLVDVTEIDIAKPDPIKVLESTNNKIEMIKAVRGGLSIGLKEAKQMVDGYLMLQGIGNRQDQLNALTDIANIYIMSGEYKAYNNNTAYKVREILNDLVEELMHQLVVGEAQRIIK